MNKKEPKKLVTFFSNKPLSYLLTLSFSVIAASILLLISLFYSQQYLSRSKETFNQTSQETIDKLAFNLDNQLHKMMQLSDTVYYSLLKEKDLVLDEKNLADSLKYLYLANGDELSEIRVFQRDGKALLNYPTMPFHKETDVTKEDWFLNAQRKIDKVYFSTPHLAYIEDQNQHRFAWVMTLSREVEVLVDNHLVTGILMMNFKFSTIVNQLEDSTTNDFRYFYLANNKGEAFYHPFMTLPQTPNFKEIQGLKKNKDGHFDFQTEGEKKRLLVKTIGYTGWRLGGVASLESFSKAVKKNRLFFALMTFIALALILVLNLIVSRYVSKPIYEMDRSLKKIEDSIEAIEIPVEGTTEIRHLGQTLNSLLDTLRRLMKDIVQQERRQRSLEMNALQAQINPHFLYNTLDSIVWMIESENYEGAIEMTTQLAKFFRVVLSKGKNIIPLETEFKHVDSYLQIQKIRYKNKFSYTLDLPQDLKQNVAPSNFPCNLLLKMPFIMRWII